MLDTPIQISRPKKASDGAGGSTITFDEAGAFTLWVDPVLESQDEFALAFQYAEDVRIGDVLKAPSTLFTQTKDTTVYHLKVVKLATVPGKPCRQATLERIER